MYESYNWPGAYSLKDEFRILLNNFKKIFDGILNEIKSKP